MAALYDALVDLSPVHDAEIMDGYRRYETLLTTILTPEQMESYANAVRQSGTVRVFAEMSSDELARLTPDENAIARAVLADENVWMENRRVASLLNQRGQHDAAPDLDWNT